VRIVLFNWRDRKHPGAGGAELYTHEALTALHAAGHECVWFASAAPGLAAVENFEHYTVVRRGSELTCRFEAARWLYRRRAETDLVIDEVNTLPWFSPWITPGKTLLLMHQLAREVWWAEAPFWAACVGYVMEPVYLQIYRRTPVITISQSSARSLRQIGLRGPIHVVECPLEPPIPMQPRTQPGLVGYVGRLAPSKRVDHVIRAVAIARQNDSRIRLRIVGGGSDAELERLTRVAADAGISAEVKFFGRVSDEERDRLMSEIDVLALASLREGWGLVVSEAARFTIPSVAYDVPGLRDSIVDEKTGLLVQAKPRELALAIAHLVRNRDTRQAFGARAARRLSEFSKQRFCERVVSAVEAHA